MKVAAQTVRAVDKMYSILGFIDRDIENKSKELMQNLYKTFVRPQLEYCVQLCTSYYRKDGNELETVQKMFMRMVLVMRPFSDEDRLKRLGLFSLERRR
eukprot:g44906.t1